MQTELKEVIIKRFQSLLWRIGGYAIAGFLALILDVLNLLELSPQLIAIVGLIFGEITKFLKVNLPQLQMKLE